MKRLKVLVAKVKFHFAYRHYRQEYYRWRDNYDCGQELYNHITGGRLRIAEIHYKAAHRKLEELRDETP